MEIDGRHANDCPQFAPLFATTAENFKLREVSADAAYLSRANFDLVAAQGAVPFVPFQSNTTGKAGGSKA